MPLNPNDSKNLATHGFPSDHRLAGREEEVIQLQAIGNLFYRRGWSVGTSSNYSVVSDRDPLELVVTASGKDKGRLSVEDFVLINQQGVPVIPDQPKSSAETQLHVVVARKYSEVGAVLHTHSPWATLLSDHFFDQGAVTFQGFEMLKGLEGITTHDTTYRLPIFENTQNIPELATEVEAWLDGPLPEYGAHGYLIRKHGLYAWGADLAAALRHIEIYEFLLECVGRQLLMGKSSAVVASS